MKVLKLIIGCLLFTINVHSQSVVGCIDPIALNFSSEATIDDGSCYYICEETSHTLVLLDTYGDGWNNNELVINGVSYTFDVGEINLQCLNLNSCLLFGWIEGSWLSEVSWELYSNSEDLIANGAGGENSPDIGNNIDLIMSDSYGDGWNGNNYIISDENGDFIHEGTLDDGSQGVSSFCLLDGCYSIEVDGGSWQSEISWNIEGVVSGFAPDSQMFSINYDCVNFLESSTLNASTLFNGVQEINVSTIGDINYLNDVNNGINTKYIDDNNDTVFYTSNLSAWNDNHFVYGLEMYNSAHSPPFGVESLDLDEDIYFKIISNGIEKYTSETMYDNSGYRLYEQDITELDDDYSIQFWDYDNGNSDDLYYTINYNSLNSNNTSHYNYNTDYTMYIIDYKLYRSNNNPHIDAHWGSSKAHDYFYETFGRNGFNDNNGVIENVFNTSYFSSETYYDSDSNKGYIEYQSDSIRFDANYWSNSDVGIDNVGNNFSDLIALSISENREGEYGALAKSFGNIFGVCIERYTKPNNWNWLIGEYAELPVLEYPNIDITDNFDISLSNPSLSDTPQATYYQGDDWDSDGNVYINSGVQNLWFYNLSSGTAFLNNASQFTAIEGVGVDKAAVILYNNFLNLPDTATYYNAFINSMSVCDSIYGSTSIEKNQMMLAWESVGFHSIYGCTNPIAFNFNTQANTDDGSCIEVVYGCSDVSAFNYDETVNTDNGSCIAVVFGCIDDTSFNYSELANTDDESCYPIINGCLDLTAFNYEQPIGDTQVDVNTDDGTCYPVIVGCMDAEAFNYIDLTGDLYLDVNTADSSCVPVILGCTDFSMFNFNSESNTDDGTCIEVVYGCSDETAFNYDETVNTDNGSCIAVVLGCINSDAVNYTPEANTDDGTCVEAIYGCTDSTALNYNSEANIDNETCVEVVEGCTDTDAFNFNEFATVDDDSCDLPPSSQTISLPEGWSMFSTYIEPENTDMSSVLAPIVSNVIIAKNYMGQAYLTEWGFNGIGEIVNGQGYQIKVDTTNAELEFGQNIELTINGTFLNAQNTPIHLDAGWNMMGYLRTDDISAVDVLADINESENLVIAKNYLGGAYLPEWGFNGLGYMQPGQGYQLKTLEEDTLWMLPMSQEYRTSQSTIVDNSPVHYKLPKTTGNNMVIGIFDEAWSITPNIGDEILVIDNQGIQVGAALYTSPVTVITVWGDDDQTELKEGLFKNENFILKQWNSASREELNLKVDSWVSGGNYYEVDAIHQISSLVQEQVGQKEFEFISCFPNPANSETSLKFYISVDKTIEMNVSNVLGDILVLKDKTTFKKGYNEMNIKTDHLEAGSYFINIIADGHSQTKILSVVR